MIDNYGRSITYLRISITDRCNFRCRYCMPEHGVKAIPHAEVLRYEEVLRVARLAVGLGVRAIRVTGGEPLVRRGVVDFVRQLSGLKCSGLQDLSLTTNGSLLAGMAIPLKRAGLDRVNISLDTMDPGKFEHVTRTGSLNATLSGIGAAIAAGLSPVKVNVVVTASTNMDEIADFAFLAYELPVEVRFIELMPLGIALPVEATEFVPAKKMRQILSAAGEIVNAATATRGAGPARYCTWRPAPGGSPSGNALSAIQVLREAMAAGGMTSVVQPDEPFHGRIGFITAMTEHFCPSCSRLRLTSDGKINPCLWSNIEVDIKSALRSGASDAEISDIMLHAACGKPKDYQSAVPGTGKRRMSRLGG